jgi:hypothetical protein
VRLCALLFACVAGCSAADGAGDVAPTPDAATEEDTTSADDVRVDETVSVDTESAEANDAAPETAADATPVIDSGCANSTAKPGKLTVIEVDAHTGDEATTMPKTDANDGKNGDNPAFRRHNVARAHSLTYSYWFTSKHVDVAGEPDPAGEQWVDYVPPLGTLGRGKYKLVAYYRQSDNRAPYPAVYEVHHAGGVTKLTRDQRLGSELTGFELGTFDLGCDGFVRAIDTGTDSICFAKMELTYVGPP